MLVADDLMEPGFALSLKSSWGSIVFLLPLLLFALYAVYWIWFRSGKN